MGALWSLCGGWGGLGGPPPYIVFSVPPELEDEMEKNYRTFPAHESTTDGNFPTSTSDVTFKKNVAVVLVAVVVVLLFASCASNYQNMKKIEELSQKVADLRTYNDFVFSGFGYGRNSRGRLEMLCSPSSLNVFDCLLFCAKRRKKYPTIDGVNIRRDVKECCCEKNSDVAEFRLDDGFLHYTYQNETSDTLLDNSVIMEPTWKNPTRGRKRTGGRNDEDDTRIHWEILCLVFFQRNKIFIIDFCNKERQVE